jgi:hypothetical protein
VPGVTRLASGASPLRNRTRVGLSLKFLQIS